MLDIIRDHCMDTEWGTATAPTELSFGTVYGAHEMPLGTVDELASLLQQEAPSAVFEVWQDPHQVADGKYIAHVPGVGTYIADCDAQGNPHVDVNVLHGRLSDCPEGMTVREWLDSDAASVLGTAVLAALRPYQDTATSSPVAA
ncbi:DUF3145 family protein [Streptomyces longwoodensis]|uniref:DUF3145 family protein n=1 Tax=Streptomyces longwoodensis TaxID=68231 RepID=UPI0033D20227